MRWLVPAIAILLLAVSARAYEKETPSVQDELITGTSLPKKLSDFGFFADERGTTPNSRVVPYELNSPLFSDYAEKYRYIYVPDGKRMTAISGDDLIDFPVGTAIIKSFGYEQNEKVRLLETRVLLHRADGWLALPYVWNTEQTQAILKVAGKRLPVTFTDPSGNMQSISYAVPNKNQCKECHSLSGEVQPIGPKLRNLDDDSLKLLTDAGFFAADPPLVQPMPDYTNTDVSVDRRARAYLDVNCAHCHNRKGSASNSGLFLTYEERDGVAVGMGKRPTAAGRGSGGMEFAIAPGHPEQSYLIYRLKSLDPGIAMPEVGRSTVHEEGVELLSQWIAGME